MEVDKVLILEDNDKKKTVPKLNNFNIICRICLKEVKTGKSLDEVEEQIKIQSLIESYTPIKLSESEDNFPQKLCKKCIDFLIQIHIFRSRCLLNQDLLHRIWSESIKLETNSKQIDNTDYFLNSRNNLKPSVKEIIKKINDELLGVYRCKSCPEVFQTPKELSQHRLKAKHSVNPTCPCPYCGRKFNQQGLKIHLRTHTKERPFVCKECGAAFTIDANLQRHMKSHIREKMFYCKFCEKKYRTAASLAAHIQIHAYNNEEVNINDEFSDNFKCNICEKCFENRGDLMMHMKSHGRAYLCSTCGIVCGGNAQLIQHMRTHSGDRPYSCLTCTKSFATAAVLKCHQITHTDEKPHECEVCHKRFKLKGTLNVHAASHKNIMNYQCVVCGKGFRRKPLLEMHMRIHTGYKKYECTICSKKFLQQTHLIYHTRIHNGEKPYACEYCGKTFAVKGNLTVHQRLHTGERPYECRICQKGFMDSSSRKKHEEKLHDMNIPFGEDLETFKKQNGGDETKMEEQFDQSIKSQENLS